MKSILFAALLFSSANVMASCTTVANYAKEFMSARQVGVPINELLKVIGNDEAMRSLALEAYDRTRWSTDSQRVQAIMDFKEEIYSLCIRNE